MSVKLEAFVEATPENKDEILEYLRVDLGNSLYLNMDIEMYEIGGDIISVWLQRRADGSIVSVAMKYSDSYQLYAREDDYDEMCFNDIVELIHYYDVMRVSAPGGIIRKLLDYIGDEYDDSYGVVMEMTKYRSLTDPAITVEEASREDIPEVVDVVLSDPMFGQSYEHDAMIKLLEDQYDRGAGASYVIRKDGNIVAHLGLVAMTETFVIASYTVVLEEARDFPYGAFLDSYLINNILPGLGKRGFAFMQIPLRIKLFDLMGCPTVGEYGKLLKKKEN